MSSTPIYPLLPLDSESLGNGEKNVAVAGTAEQLDDNTPCSQVLIQVKRTNTGRIYVGGAGVPNNDTGGVVLAPPPAATVTPDSVMFFTKNLNKVYINSTVNGEGVIFTYWK